MDLVPYDSEARQIILRHGNTLVVYDERSKQLSTSHVRSTDANDCPYCHRPFDKVSEPGVSDNAVDDDAAFVSASYFKRLASSHSETTSSSPRWRLVQPSSASPASSRLIDGRETRETRSHGGRISSTAFSQGYFERFFISERELGRGGKGVVLLVKHVLDGVTLGRFACKRVPVGDSHDWLENVLMEVSLLQDMVHENLVAYRHVWLEDFKATDFAPSTPHIFILQQFCNSGTLLEYVLGSKPSSQAAKERLKDRARRFSNGDYPPSHGLRSGRRLLLEEIFSFFKDITSGLAHLHANGYVHRDLKPQNCLLHRNGNTVRALVSDFGEMQGVSVPRRPMATGYTGTISFAAPEVISRDHKGAFGNFTDKSDVFSLGMVVFFMCFGRLPYLHADLEDERNEDLAQLKAEILSWTGLDAERRERTDLPEKLYGFLQLLLSHDPAERPTTESILQGIRGGSAFSAHGPSSPVKEHYHSPELGVDSGRPSSSQGDGSTMKRRNTRPRRPSAARVESSGNSPHQIADVEVARGVQGTSGLADHAVVSSADGTEHNSTSAHMQGASEPDVPMLLPPPRHSRIGQLIRAYSPITPSSNAALVLKSSLFLVKTWFLLHSCDPFAINASIGYPLFAIAGIDLAWSASSVYVPLLLAVVHVAGLYIASTGGHLCQAGQRSSARD